MILAIILILISIPFLLVIFYLGKQMLFGCSYESKTRRYLNKKYPFGNIWTSPAMIFTYVLVGTMVVVAIGVLFPNVINDLETDLIKLSKECSGKVFPFC